MLFALQRTAPSWLSGRVKSASKFRTQRVSGALQCCALPRLLTGNFDVFNRRGFLCAHYVKSAPNSATVPISAIQLSSCRETMRIFSHTCTFACTLDHNTSIMIDTSQYVRDICHRKMLQDPEFLRNELFYLVVHAAVTPNDILLKISRENSEHHDFLVQKAFQGVYYRALDEIKRKVFNVNKFTRSFRNLYRIIHSDDIRSGMMSDLKRLTEIAGQRIGLGPVTREFVSKGEILHVPPTMTVAHYACFGRHRNFQNMDLAPLRNVKRIGISFLFGCERLRSLDLSPLRNVVTIGAFFLYGCTGLTALDFSPLSNVTSIGDYFLDGCSALHTLDIGSLHRVKTIKSGFLCGCSSLRTLNLSSLCNVVSIGDCFLDKCSSLQTLDLRPLCNVTVIGSCFLCKCLSLKTLDLTPLRNVIAITYRFLYGVDARLLVSHLQTQVLEHLKDREYTIIE